MLTGGAVGTIARLTGTGATSWGCELFNVFGAVLGICLLTPVFAGDGREDNAGVESEVADIGRASDRDRYSG